jgi:uncharacterized membrane protein YccC
MSFFSNLLGTKAQDAVDAGVRAYVGLDPAGAAKAELKTIEDHLDACGKDLVEARQTYAAKSATVANDKAAYDQKLAAADILQSKTATADAATKASLEHSLTTLVGELEALQGKSTLDQQDADLAKQLLDQLEVEYNETRDQLLGAQRALEQARLQQESAERQKEMAERQAEAAKRASGLSTRANSLNVALTAMQENTKKSQIEADAAKMKAAALRPAGSDGAADANIAAAMAEASGKPAAVSVADRLAALKAGKPQ